VLKKTGTVVALAAVGLLSASPLAFAGDRSRGHGDVDVTDQENEQESNQGNGILNGNNILSGNAVQVCDVNVAALNGVIAQIPLILAAANAEGQSDVQQQGGTCNAKGTAVGQTTDQDASNDKD